jgi:transcriptional regulator with XRE-family HTH domain
VTQERATFDAAAFFAALDAVRQARSSNWKQVAQGADISPSTLTRMAQGKRPDVDTLAALCAWAGLDAGDYVRRPATAGTVSPEPLAQISTYLRADPNLSAEAATAIDELVKATYSRLRTRGG